MSIELDHLFILTDVGAAQADKLTSFGLLEGVGNRHPGQGTSNRRFHFAGLMLEFLYIHDVRESKEGPAKDLRFHDRSKNAGASPFGLIMRSTGEAKQDLFEGWKYCPEYFASNQCFHVGMNSGNLEEPLCICMPDNLPPRKSVPVPENPEWEFTSVRLSVPAEQLSSPLKRISECENVDVVLDRPHCLELTFNDNAQKQQKDFRPALPLIFNW